MSKMVKASDRAIAAGLTCAIVDPTDPGVVQAVVAADLLAGRDEYGRRYLAHYRKGHTK